MKISIAMATYNGAKYLQEQLNSFIAQARQPDELVITDDGSTDCTLELVRTFSERAPFPVIWEQNNKNLGYAQNFNKTLEKTTGDLVFLSDQDDYWLPDKIRVIEAFASRSKSDVVFINDAEIADSSLNRTGLTRLGQISAGGYSKKNYVQGACTAIRGAFVDLALPIPEGFNHDSWIHWLGMALDGRAVCPEVLQLFRRHSTNMSDSPTSGMRKIGKMTRLWVSASPSYLNHSPRHETLAIELEKRNEILRRIYKILPVVNDLWPEKGPALENSDKVIRSEAQALMRRKEIAGKPRLSRLAPQIILLSKIGLAQYGGARAFAKDILIR